MSLGKFCIVLGCLLLMVGIAAGAAATDTLKPGKADLKSAGVLAFGPDGILFVGDSMGAAIFALDTQDRGPAKSAGAVEIKGINEKIAAMLGTAPDQILINDMAVNPPSEKSFLPGFPRRGPEAAPGVPR